MPYGKWNRRYGLRGVYTTRPFPRRLRAPLGTARIGRGTYRRFRRLGVGRRRLQNLVVQLNEHKYLDQNTHSDCVYYEGQVYDFCTNITSGPGQGQRIGGKVVLSSISMMGKIYFDWDDTVHRGDWAKNASVRMIVYFWKDDTAATLATLLKPTSTPDAEIAPFYPYNEEMRGKRKVLHDRTFQLNNDMYPYTPCAGSASAVSFNVFLDFRKMPIGKRTVSFDATGVIS